MDAKTNVFMNVFWIGFAIYTLFFTILVSNIVPYRFVVVFQMVQFFGVFIFLLAAFSLIRFKLSNNYLLTVLSLFLFWQLITVMRGFIFEVEYIKNSLLDLWFGILIYFAPVIMLFPNIIASFKKISKVIIILGIFFLLYDMIFIKDLLYPYGGNRLSQALIEYFSRNLSMACGFLLFTYIYNSDKKNFTALGIIVLTLLLSAIRARRSLMFMTMTILVISYIIFYFSNKGKVTKVIFSIILILSLIMYGAYVYTSQRNGMFGLLSSRMYEDTRSGVVQNFYNAMSTTDWIFGKGINGIYFCPGIDEGNRITIYRSVIETGYLQVILKGGILSLSLFLLLALPAMYLGFFKSKNILVKGAAAWILWYIINMYSSTGNGFVMTYILVWVSIGLCFHKGIRAKTDTEMKVLLQ